jgi:hypothetical protein
LAAETAEEVDWPRPAASAAGINLSASLLFIDSNGAPSACQLIERPASSRAPINLGRRSAASIDHLLARSDGQLVGLLFAAGGPWRRRPARWSARGLVDAILV